MASTEDTTPDWGSLMRRLPDDHLQNNRWDITLGINPAGRPGRAGWVYVAELGDNDVYWPVGSVSAEVRRGDLAGLMRAAYDATREAVTPAG